MSDSQRNRKGNRKRQSGQGLVEFALILPLLLFIVMGIIDFARIFIIYAMVSNGAREAVRYGAVPGQGRNAGDYNYMHCDEMRARAQQSVPLLDIEADLELGFDHGSGAPNSWAFTCGNVAAAQIIQGDRIVASIDTEVELITPLINNIWPTLPLRFTAARTIIKDGIQTGPTQTPWPTRTPRPPTSTPTAVPTEDCQGNPQRCEMTRTAAALTATGVVATNTLPPATNTPMATPTCSDNPPGCRATGTVWAATMTRTANPGP